MTTNPSTAGARTRRALRGAAVAALALAATLVPGVASAQSTEATEATPSRSAMPPVAYGFRDPKDEPRLALTRADRAESWATARTEALWISASPGVGQRAGPHEPVWPCNIF